MTDDARPFIEHIAAHVDDDAPRLVFADWLEERGDSARAEFIRLQCERAKLPEWDRQRVVLGVREDALLKEHGKRWLAELPEVAGVTWGEFRRGFVAAATFRNFKTLRAAAAECWAAAPIESAAVRWPRKADAVGKLAPIPALRELTVTGRVVDHEDVGRLADAPVLSTLRSFTAGDCAVGTEGFRRLLGSPHLRGLRSLNVPLNGLGDGGVSILTATNALPALEELDLSETSEYGRYGEDPLVTAAGFEALAAWPGLARLRSLDLSGGEPERSGLRALLSSPHAVGLKTLGLFNCDIEADVAEEFAAARPGVRLDSLNLMENYSRQGGTGQLAQADCLRELKSLDLGRCGVTEDDARALAAAPFFPVLRMLNLEFNLLAGEGMRALFGKGPLELHTLSLERNELSDDDDAGVRALAESPAAASLLSVDLRRNYVGDSGGHALAASPHLADLLTLHMPLYGMSEGVRNELVNSPLGRRVGLKLPKG